MHFLVGTAVSQSSPVRLLRFRCARCSALIMVLTYFLVPLKPTIVRYDASEFDAELTCRLRITLASQLEYTERPAPHTVNVPVHLCCIFFVHDEMGILRSYTHHQSGK
jgi:hypothetical protein